MLRERERERKRKRKPLHLYDLLADYMTCLLACSCSCHKCFMLFKFITFSSQSFHIAKYDHEGIRLMLARSSTLYMLVCSLNPIGSFTYSAVAIAVNFFCRGTYRERENERAREREYKRKAQARNHVTIKKKKK